MDLQGEFSAAPETAVLSGGGSPTLPHAVPLGIWLAAQVAALLAAALQVPFSDQFARPAERLAIHEMAIAQIVAAALLMPLLLRRVDTSVMVAATAWPFLQLAGVLSSTPTARVALCAAYVSAWVAFLAAWRWIVPGRAGRLLAAAIATTLSLGGAGLWYLQAEFVRQSANPQWPTDAHYGPIVAVVALLEGAATGTVWMDAIAAAFFTVVAVGARLKWRRIAPGKNSATEAHP